MEEESVDQNLGNTRDREKRKTKENHVYTKPKPESKPGDTEAGDRQKAEKDSIW